MRKIMPEFDVTVIIAAAGSGKRLNAGINKIWLELAGMTILERSIRVFLKSAFVTAIVVVVAEAEVAIVQEVIVRKNLGRKTPIHVVSGGLERQDSVYNGLKFVKQNLPGGAGTNQLVAIHDAARPLLTQDILTASVGAAFKYGAAGVGVPVKDTIKQADPEGFITGTPERSTLWAIQTPQVFEFNLLWDCYHKAAGKGLYFSDDCGVVEHCGRRIRIIPGSYDNIKITTPEDIELAEIILKRRKERA